MSETTQEQTDSQTPQLSNDNDLSGYAGPRFKNESEQYRFAEASFGIEVEAFFQSEVGTFLLSVAEQEIEIAKDKLLAIEDPTTEEGKKAWYQTKMECQSATNFKKWCAEAIIRGRSAADELEMTEKQEY